MSKGKPWTDKELVLALALYVQLPFSKLDRRNKVVISFAAQMGRTPGSLAMKMLNFAACDPEIVRSGRSGLSHNSKDDQKFFDSFLAADSRDYSRLFDTACSICAESGLGNSLFLGNNDPGVNGAIEVSPPEGRDALVIRKERVGQAFFRNAVLAKFAGKCAVTGLGESSSSLVEAAHIIPWAECSGVDLRRLRLDPHNGLALSPLLHKCLDLGLIGIDPDYRLHVGRKLARDGNAATRDYLGALDGIEICRPAGASASFIDVQRGLLSRRFAEFRN